MKAALAAGLLMTFAAEARPRRAVIAAQEPAPEKPASALLAPEQLVDRAEKMFAQLDYDQALPILRRLIADPSLPLEVRIRALALEGSTLAITSDVADAERPFRKLLRLKPDFEISPKSPPKILAAFRKVQTEERMLAEELETTRRQRQVAKLKLLDELPAEGRGGKPLKFSLRVFDPDGAVGAVRVPYRRAGEQTFSSLALTRDETGTWSGVLPGEVTGSSDAYALELYVLTLDGKGGPLLSRGTEAEPLKIEMSAGTPRRFRLPRAAFVTALCVTVAGGVVSGVLGLQLAQTQADYNATYLPGSATPTQLSSEAWAMERARGDTLANATTIALISTAALAAATVVIGLLVDWFD